MGKRFKFSPLKARILMMIGPMLSLLPFGFVLFVSIYATVSFGFSFWLKLIRETFMGFVLWMLFDSMFGILIYRMIKGNLRISRNVRELKDSYPELEEDWQNLNDADCLDKRLKVLVYGDHLICYRTFDIAYLPECSKIDAFMKMYRLGSRHKVRRVHFSAWYLDGSESELRTNEFRRFVEMNQNAHKDALFDYLRENFDYIELETFE